MIIFFLPHPSSPAKRGFSKISYQERTGEIEPLVPQASRLQSLISH